jgi:hypothetical protein
LGLATDNVDITPDYKKTPQEVFIEVARAQINSTQNLDIITQSLWPLGSPPSMVQHANGRHLNRQSSLVDDLPSWLPNFSFTTTKKILFAQRSIFSAGAERCKCPVEIASDGTLTVTGIALGAIATMKQVEKALHPYTDDKYFFSCVRAWIPDDLAEPNAEAESYVTQPNAFEAYWRTLMTDCLAYPSRRLSQDDLKEYTEIFSKWRQNLPLRDPALGQPLWSMRDIVDRTGISTLIGDWQFAELDGGLYAMVPREGVLHGDNNESKIGDLVVIVDGGKVPLVLREMNSVGEHENDGGKWAVIGTAYVHGFMDGLASQWADDGRLTKRDFSLI